MNTVRTMDTELLELHKLTEPDRPITYGVVKPGPEDPSTCIVFIRGGDISNGLIDEENLRTITQEVSRPYARTILRGGEVVISLVGNPGEVAVVPDRLAGANLARQAGLIALRPEIDAAYIKYYLMSPPGKAELIQRTQGAVQQVINLSDLKRVKIQLPCRRVQEGIVSILSAYDDLIENNRRRIALLEEAARLLYREWFVHFRFPGHEHVKITDGLPEGWDRRYLGDVVTTQYGHTASASEEKEGPKFVRGTDINKRSFIDWSSVPYCPEQGLDFDKYALVPGDILVIRMADPGKVALVEEPVRAVFASYLVRLKIKNPRETPPTVLFMTLMDEHYQGFVGASSGGATRKSASAKLLTDFHFVLPPKNLLQLFVEQVIPLRGMIRNLVDQSASSAQARDLLLPRLMNGEIAV